MPMSTSWALVRHLQLLAAVIEDVADQDIKGSWRDVHHAPRLKEPGFPFCGRAGMTEGCVGCRGFPPRPGGPRPGPDTVGMTGEAALFDARLVCRYTVAELAPDVLTGLVNR